MFLQVASPALASTVEDIAEEATLQEESILTTDVVEETVTDSNDSLSDEDVSRST